MKKWILGFCTIALAFGIPIIMLIALLSQSFGIGTVPPEVTKYCYLYILGVFWGALFAILDWMVKR